jgi:hypothetical protein
MGSVLFTFKIQLHEIWSERDAKSEVFNQYEHTKSEVFNQYEHTLVT